MKVADYFTESLIMETTRFAHTMRYMTGLKDPGHGFGIVTSENPYGERLSKEENKKLLGDLKSRLIDDGVNFTGQWGKFGYEENSLFLFDVDVEYLMKLAKIFEQASFIWGVKEKDGSMSFAYIDMGENDITDVKYRVNAGTEVQSREDNVSAFWYKVKKKGTKEAQYFFRKYFIPFFSSDERKTMKV